MTRTNGWLPVILCVPVIGTAASVALAQGGDPLTRLRERFPGVFTRQAGGDRIRQIFGVPMTGGETAREAAEAWIAEFAPIFAGEGIDLREVWAHDPGRGKVFFAYQQFIDDIPVHKSIARVMVMTQPTPRVVYAAAQVTPHPSRPLPQPSLTPAQAVEAARTDPRAAGLTHWGQPSQAVWAGQRYGLDEIVGRVWLCRGESPREHRHFLFVVDAVNGTVHAVIDQVRHAFPNDPQISGTVTATIVSDQDPTNLSPFWGDGQHDCEAELVEVPLYYVRVEVLFPGETVYAFAYADSNGEYEVNAPAGQAVKVRAKLSGANWVVKHCLTDPEAGCPTGVPLPVTVENVTAPQVVDLEYPVPTAQPNQQHQLAQTTLYYIIGQLNNYCNQHGIFPTDGVPFLTVSANMATRCNANYAYFGAEADIVLEYGEGGQNGPLLCPNWAFSTIAAHEFGHWVHNVLLVSEWY